MHQSKLISLPLEEDVSFIVLAARLYLRVLSKVLPLTLYFDANTSTKVERRDRGIQNGYGCILMVKLVFPSSNILILV